jgi:sec-independent protein translocase protein TatC
MASGNFFDSLSMGGHLEDLKKLAIRLVATIAVGVSISAIFAQYVYALVLDPIKKVTVTNDGREQPLVLTFLKVHDALTFQLDMILFAGILITLPISIFWIWKFVEPALLDHEKKFAGVYVLIAGFLSMLGAVYAYKLILPFSLNFFTKLNLNSALVNTQYAIDANGYLEFFKTLFLATLATFQIPIVVFTLLRSRLIPPSFISNNRKMIYFGIMASLFIMIPGDVSISIMVVLPIIVLFEIAYVLGKLGIRQKQV